MHAIPELRCHSKHHRNDTSEVNDENNASMHVFPSGCLIPNFPINVPLNILQLISNDSLPCSLVFSYKSQLCKKRSLNPHALFGVLEHAYSAYLITQIHHPCIALSRAFSRATCAVQTGQVNNAWACLRA